MKRIIASVVMLIAIGFLACNDTKNNMTVRNSYQQSK